MNVLSWSALALLLAHFFLGDYLRESFPGYSVARTLIMALIILCMLVHRPKFDKWALALIALLFVRFFFGDFLIEKTSWYVLVSYLLMAVITTVLIINVIRSYLSETSRK